MSAICGIVSLDGRPVAPSHLAAMVARCQHRLVDEVFYHRQAGMGVACLSRDSSSDGTGACRPEASPDGHLVLVADARLDNREACLAWQPSAFTQRETATDGHLMFGTLLHDPQGGPGRLIGDFAYALWDGGQRTLQLARDAMGMRSLYYRVESGRILFATELSQILAVEGVRRRANRLAMAWHLSDLQTPPGCTFFEGIDEVLPGEEVEIDARGRVRRRVIWKPDPDDRLHYRDSGDYAEHFRALLVEAVRCRSRVASPAAISLSGGMDSGSIASIAGWLAEQGRDMPALRAYSWAFTQHPECDERDNIYRLAKRFSIPVKEIPAEQTYPLMDLSAYVPDEDGPFNLIYQGFVDKVLRGAAADGCRSAWFGFRGDVVVGGSIHELAGLVRDGRWREARHELAGLRHDHGLGRTRGLCRFGIRPVLDDALSLLTRPLRQAPFSDARLSAYSPRDRLPSFVTPDLALRAGLPGRDPLVADSNAWIRASHRERYRQIFSPLVMSVMRLVERQCATHGLVRADPWSDRRLAAFVLACPQHRVDGFRQPKRLARQAVRGIMPDEALQHCRKVMPAPLYEHAIRHLAYDRVLDLMTDSRCAALGLIDEAQYRALFRRHCRGAPQAVDFWPALSLELWLRRWWA
ncbi:asparagine synthetase B family protein [Halomonas saccharevitans]|uniref:asparagine synthase (glutamine-hydrolyzing) n=1 Tax=Halomonas saccharevitans TaxID=416872 RepID=A0A1I7BE77_9GAMM|nr:asparagine synthase-related protein [Halomonas saccharevitans]SFT85402.1 asparagine synthase (glutamine-hydrolysing) [Halomonas saccharevitans]